MNPELYECIKGKRKVIKYDSKANDIYSLAMCIVHLGL